MRHISLNVAHLCPSTIREIGRDLADTSYEDPAHRAQAKANYEMLSWELFDNMGEELPPFDEMNKDS